MTYFNKILTSTREKELTSQGAILWAIWGFVSVAAIPMLLANGSEIVQNAILPAGFALVAFFVVNLGRGIWNYLLARLRGAPTPKNVLLFRVDASFCLGAVLGGLFYLWLYST